MTSSRANAQGGEPTIIRELLLVDGRIRYFIGHDDPRHLGVWNNEPFNYRFTSDGSTQVVEKVFNREFQLTDGVASLPFPEPLASDILFCLLPALPTLEQRLYKPKEKRLVGCPALATVLRSDQYQVIDAERQHRGSVCSVLRSADRQHFVWVLKASPHCVVKQEWLDAAGRTMARLTVTEVVKTAEIGPLPSRCLMEYYLLNESKPILITSTTLEYAEPLEGRLDILEGARRPGAIEILNRGRGTFRQVQSGGENHLLEMATFFSQLRPQSVGASIVSAWDQTAWCLSLIAMFIVAGLVTLWRQKT